MKTRELTGTEFTSMTPGRGMTYIEQKRALRNIHNHQTTTFHFISFHCILHPTTRTASNRMSLTESQ